jgi:exodeoxyribonuclease-3
MKIVTWNVNGIRSVFKTTFLEWLKSENPDIVCLQEIKADEGELTDEFTHIDGYYAYFHSARKKGYSGVAVYTKVKPVTVDTVLGMERFDDEGRGLKLTFPDFTLFNFYIPHGGRMKENLNYKLDVYKQLFSVLANVASKEVILTGDFNIAHAHLDLCYPKQNENNTMFTPRERQQLDTLISLGYVDTFRSKYPEKRAYTWWPYALDARERDMGWRIDYIFVTKSLEGAIDDAFMRREIQGSDHGPFGVMLNIKFEAKDRPIYLKIPSQDVLL